MNKKALTRWNKLSSEKQQELLQQCTDGKVIELNQDGSAQVVGIFFGMEINIDSPKEYVFPDDVQQQLQEESDAVQANLEFALLHLKDARLKGIAAAVRDALNGFNEIKKSLNLKPETNLEG